MQATFEKKPTPRNQALNRLIAKKQDLELELFIYKCLLAVICLAALTNVLGIN